MNEQISIVVEPDGSYVVIRDTKVVAVCQEYEAAEAAARLMK